MFYLYVTVAVFALAVLINSFSVYIQKKYKFYQKFKRPLLWHTLVILPAWLTFAYFLVNLSSNSSLEFIKSPYTGLALIVIAVCLFVTALQATGSQALVNGNFFGETKIINTGIFTYIKNPYYTSYWLLFIGLGFMYGNGSFLVIAAESFILLNIIEAKIEEPV